jgi:hypothetical protein
MGHRPRALLGALFAFEAGDEAAVGLHVGAQGGHVGGDVHVDKVGGGIAVVDEDAFAEGVEEVGGEFEFEGLVGGIDAGDEPFAVGFAGENDEFAGIAVEEFRVESWT